MLVNKRLANKTVATAHGSITFNDKGECSDLSIEKQKKLGNLRGFTFVEEKKEEPKKEESKKEADKKDEPKKEDEKKEEPKKEEKSKPKTTKKAPAKKKEDKE